MMTKTAKHQYFFETRLTRTAGLTGLLSADEVEATIRVATPPEFSGEPGNWSPEELLLGSLCSCLMATYLAFASKKGITVAHFDCHAIGQVELVEGHLAFTTINLFPRITVSKEEELAPANEVLLKTYKHCIIANSINAHLVHHGEVMVEGSLLQEKN
jgi:organic hydroperoxide reductase OsmC/OhrA